MKIIQYLFVIFALSTTNQLLIGQRNVKYKDVYKVIEEKSKEEAYSLLLVYQKQDPFFANTYFQLGLLAQYWSKDYDALTNLRDVEFFIYNTNLYYGLAMSKIDQKEIRKNDNFYMNVDRFKNKEKLEFDEVRSFLQEQIDANNEYNKNVQIVTRLFNSSINHYNNCIRIFKEINTNNNKIKDIYLTADAKFLVKLNELESSFDSTIYYLQNYQTAIKNYPIKNYNQKYKLLPIETYRLHGLTGSDFLKDEIPIWNYGTWVKDVKQILNSEIADIRKSIIKADQQLNENISLLAETKEYKSDFNQQKVDEKLKFKIGKYDHQSLLLELFNFKESKIEFLAIIRDPLNDLKDISGSYTLVQKARFYANVLKKKELCDSLNENLGKHINAYDINKYSDFFTNNYGGELGLQSYLKNENEFIKTKLKSTFNNLKEYLAKSLSEKVINTDTIHYKLSHINLKKSIVQFNIAKPDTFYTVDYSENSGGDFYITGYIKENGNPFYPFVAKTNKRSEIRWLKIIPSIPSVNSSGIFIQANEEGCSVLTHTSLDANSQNQILVFDNDGKQKDKIELAVSSYPRYFNFDEINQKYLLVFKGFKEDQFECLTDELTVLQYDAMIKKEAWKQNLTLHGTFVDFIMMNQSLFLITNFSSYQSTQELIKSSAGELPLQTNAMVLVIDMAGSIIKEVPVFNEKSFFITNAIKINSNSINLLGFRNELLDIKKSGKSGFGDLVYLLLDSYGALHFDNKDLK